jgi:cytochrome c oxidase cbb3-type subunit 3
MTFISRKPIFRISENRVPSPNLHRRLAFLLFVAVFALSYRIAASSQSQSGPASPSEGKSADAATGKRAYSTNCAGCHGLDGKGGERAPDIATRPRVLQLSDAALLQVVQRGVPNTGMPAFGFLDAKTQKSMVAHLRTLQGAVASAKLPGNAQRGRAIFFAKGGCANCHMIHGEGGFFGSDLGGYARGRSPESVRDAIVSPNRDLDPRRRTVVATLADGNSLEGIARNEDNFSLQLVTPDGAFHLLSKSSLAALTYRSQSPMPSDYGAKLSLSELDDLVNFLFSLTGGKSTRNAKDDSDED